MKMNKVPAGKHILALRKRTVPVLWHEAELIREKLGFEAIRGVGDHGRPVMLESPMRPNAAPTFDTLNRTMDTILLRQAKEDTNTPQATTAFLAQADRLGITRIVETVFFSDLTEKIYTQVKIPRQSANRMVGILRATFPRAEIEYDAPDELERLCDHHDIRGAQFGLENLVTYPIELKPDGHWQRLTALFEAAYWRNAPGGVQILIERCRCAWQQFFRDEATRVRLPGTGVVDPDLPSSGDIEKKATPRMYALAVRIFGTDAEILNLISDSFIEPFSTADQSLIWTGLTVSADELIGGVSRATGMLLNEPETVALATLPDKTVRSSLLDRAPSEKTSVKSDYRQVFS